MRAPFLDLITRLQVAGVTGVCSPELARAAVGEFLERATVAERRAWRNTLLRQAAAALSGSRYARAKRLVAILHGAAEENGAAVLLVRRALEVDPDLQTPTTLRQLLSILAGGEADPPLALQ